MLKKLVAFAAASALVAGPAVAQPAAMALSPSASLRAGADLSDESELGGGALVAVLGVAIVAGAILALTDDSDEDLPDSP